LLSGAFGSYADQLIDDSVARIDAQKGFDAEELFDAIRSKDKSLEISEDRLWEMGYASKTVRWTPFFGQKKAIP
jgi:hypothetical protein